jgi:hypothetical protein
MATMPTPLARWLAQHAAAIDPQDPALSPSPTDQP